MVFSCFQLPGIIYPLFSCKWLLLIFILSERRKSESEMRIGPLCWPYWVLVSPSRGLHYLLRNRYSREGGGVWVELMGAELVIREGVEGIKKEWLGPCEGSWSCTWLIMKSHLLMGFPYLAEFVPFSLVGPPGSLSSWCGLICLMLECKICRHIEMNSYVACHTSKREVLGEGSWVFLYPWSMVAYTWGTTGKCKDLLSLGTGGGCAKVGWAV